MTIAFDDISYLRPEDISVADGSTGTPIDFTNLGSYALYQATANEAQTSDLKRTAFANARRDVLVGGVAVALKGGVDFRHARRDLRGSSPTWSFVGPDGRTSTTPTAAGSDDNAAAISRISSGTRGFPPVPSSSPCTTSMTAPTEPTTSPPSTTSPARCE